MLNRTCIGCSNGITGTNRANEHIVPQWLLSVLGVRQEQLNQKIAESGSDSAVDGRSPHAISSFKEGRICGECNSGWMSTLESEARNLLPSLITGERTLFSLSEEENTILARWTLKTAVVLSHGTPLKEPLPKEHLQFIRTNKTALPPQVGVFAAAIASKHPFGYLQRNRWLHGRVENEPSTSEEDFYKVGIQLKGLLLMAAFIPIPTSHFILAAGIHIPLWPTTPLFPSHNVQIPPASPHDSLSELAFFSDALGVLHST